MITLNQNLPTLFQKKSPSTKTFLTNEEETKLCQRTDTLDPEYAFQKKRDCFEFKMKSIHRQYDSPVSLHSPKIWEELRQLQLEIEQNTWWRRGARQIQKYSIPRYAWWLIWAFFFCLLLPNWLTKYHYISMDQLVEETELFFQDMSSLSSKHQNQEDLFFISLGDTHWTYPSYLWHSASLSPQDKSHLQGWFFEQFSGLETISFHSAILLDIEHHIEEQEEKSRSFFSEDTQEESLFDFSKTEEPSLSEELPLRNRISPAFLSPKMWISPVHVSRKLSPLQEKSLPENEKEHTSMFVFLADL